MTILTPESSQPRSHSPQQLRWMRWIAIALVVLALCFRLTGLDRKVYWHDEAYTSLVITAHPGKYFREDLFQNRLVTASDLLAYPQLSPELTWTDMLVRKGTEDVQHPPLYYGLLRLWAELWGVNPTVTRGFSAMLSLLMFPAVYWLCVELFASQFTGWVGVALFAASPFQLVFAQEAREFGFWAVLAVVSSALLLRAVRVPSGRNWGWYGLSMVAAFYTGLFSLGIAIGHFLYVGFVDSENVLFQRPLRLGKRTVRCGGTLLLVSLAFIPWIYFIVTARENLETTTEWIAISLPMLTYWQSLIFNFSRSFIDFNADFSDSLAYVLAIPILMVQAYAMYLLYRTTPRRVWGLIFAIVGSTALMLGLPDLVLGGQRLAVTRYPIACYVGLQLAVVYLISKALTEGKRWKVRLAQGGLSLLIVLGVLSCGVYAQANTWWNKSVNANYAQLAELINRSDRPLIVADSDSYYPVSLISLSYLLKPETQFMLLPLVRKSFSYQPLPTNAKTIILLNLPEGFRHQFESWHHKELRLVFQDPWNKAWEAVDRT